MSGAVEWDGLLRVGAAVFTSPSFLLFWTLVSAWVLCPGRRAVTRMIGVAAPEGEHVHGEMHLLIFGLLFIVVVLALPGGLVDTWRRVAGTRPPRRAVATHAGADCSPLARPDQYPHARSLTAIMAPRARTSAARFHGVEAA